jgi:CDP-paratose 2-epimerase
MKMKWLVTGGCGFIGSNLADALLGSGCEVAVFDNLTRLGSAENLKWLRQNHGTQWQFVEADIRDQASVDALVRSFRPDSIAHLAGQVAMTTSIAEPRFDFEVNVLGTINVLESVRRLAPQSIVIYASSNKVYGQLSGLRYRETETRHELADYPSGLDENLPLNGYSPYGCSKLAADQYVRDYHRTYGLRTLVFRHSSVYGSRQFATFDQGWVGWFCQKAVEIAEGSGDVLSISGDGKQVRDILHAKDAASAYISAAAHVDVAAGQVFNIGGGQENSLSLRELFASLEASVNCPIPYTPGPWRNGDQKVFISDNTAAGRVLQWSPRICAATGIDEMIQWANLCRSLVNTS